jgi:hypothetical protein
MATSKKVEPSKKPTKRRVVIADNDEALRKFSGEECFGQYLDLYDVHRSLCALPGRDHPHYLQFLELLARAEFDFIPGDAHGEKLLDLLISSLCSFLERSESFFDLSAFRDSVKRAFAQKNMPSSHQSSAPNYCEYCDRHSNPMNFFRST